MNHTLGPWKAVKGNHPSYPKVTSIIGDGEYIAEMKHDYKPEREVANARLIAAAPELLEALERMLETFDRLNLVSQSTFRGMGDNLNLIADVRAAIAKAKGC